MKTAEDKVKSEVKKFQEMETKLVLLQTALSKDKDFRQFLKLQKAVNDKADEFWSGVRDIMIENDIQKIETDIVLLTIVNKKNLVVDEDKLADEYMKYVPDTKAINAHIKEYKKLPKGVKQVDAPYLRKTFRQFVS